eukprot:TRINITY_DN24059_c0_g1_i1.p1 TRINITY_DN24059_c0_g1~~TRINITY_DN24059_c0_g1_i1.p1  ORF type:complete len:663 (+),score=202.86 TRINITY_DN24059_c0_g1_i1:43-2031(+)
MADEQKMIDGFKKDGNTAFQAGRYEEAVAMFSMGLELAPENEVLWSNRSGAYARQGKYQRALEDAETVLKLKPTWARGYSRKAAAYEGLGKEAEALELYTTSLLKDPNNRAVGQAVENLTIRMQQRKQDALDANEAGAVKARNLQEAGNEAKKEGDLEKALECYTEAIPLQKNDEKLAVLYSNRSAVRLLLDDKEKALEDANKCVQLRPDWSRGYTRRGASLWGLERLKEARAAYSEALMYDATNDEIRKIIMKLDEEARMQLAKAANPGSPEVLAQEYKMKGNDELKKGNLDGAIEYYTKGVETDPNSHLLYSNRAAAYALQGRHSEVIEDANKVIKLAPSFAKGYARKAAAIAALAKGDVKRLQGAIKLYVEASEKDGTNEEYMEKALELEGIVTKKEEEEEMKAKEEEKEDNNLLMGLVVVEDKKQTQQLTIVEEPEVLGDRRFELEDYRGAIGYYSQELKREPRHHLLMKRGICWTKVRRYQRALIDFSEATEMHPTDLEAIWQKGDTLIKMAGAESDKDPNKSSTLFCQAVLTFKEGKKLDTAEHSRFEDALRHVLNEQTAFEMTKEDRIKVLERTKAKAQTPRSKLDWKGMSAEEKKRRQDDMKRKAEQAMFEDSYLQKQMRRGNLKDVGIAQAKKKNKKFHSGIAHKYTYTENGL